MLVKQFVEDSIAQNTITVFSKTYCRFCKEAKATLQKIAMDKKIEPEQIKIYELDMMDEMSEIQSYLFAKTNQKTVPNIFIKQQHIGGNDALQTRVRNNTLDAIFAADA